MIRFIGDQLYRLSKRKSRHNLKPWIADAVAGYKIQEARSVLNIGAGGEIGELLAELGVKAVSVDIDPDRRPDIMASAEDLKMLADASVDAVFCIEVLEHVRVPATAVAEIRRVLRPGGILIGSTPFLLGIHDAPADFWRFTRSGLEQIFSAFEFTALRERNGYFAATAVLLTRRFATGSPRQRRLALLLSPLLLPLAWMLERFDRWLPDPGATTGYFFVLRKPVQ